MSNARQFFLHAISPIHMGVGQSSGAVNLPTARERFTGHPFVPGSSLKGVLRDAAGARGTVPRDRFLEAFGPETANAADHRGGLVLSDANLLCLPVRSPYSTFVWVTSPFCLRRLKRDMAESGAGPGTELPIPPEGGALVASGSLARPGGNGDLVLEDVAVPVGATVKDGPTDQWAKIIGGAVFSPAEAFDLDGFRQRFVVASDDLFNGLVNTCLEVRVHVKIDQASGTAADSGPWTEEYSPAESIFHGVALGRVPKTGIDAAQALETLVAATAGFGPIRIGGKSSIGAGRARFLLGGAP